MAAALGIFLKRQRDSRQPDSNDPRSPQVVVAGDDRPIAPQLVAAVVEGLRWAGCDVVDLGSATAPCLAFALVQRKAAGGLLVGNPRGNPQTVGLKFWTDGPASMTPGGTLEAIRALFETPPARPQRRYGHLSRLSAENDYLDPLAQHYHGLRPLEFIVDTTCLPLVRYLQRLVVPTACRLIWRPSAMDRESKPPPAAGAHFAVHVDDDGERCRLADERGRPVAPRRLLALLARHLPSDGPQGPIVLEEGTPGRAVDEIRSLGRQVRIGDPRRSEMHRAMRDHRAILGGGPTGHYWFPSAAGHYAADALALLSHLLKTLSQTDRPLSAVLDQS
jgi:phosphomannomutase/phosphoglucomutase